MSESKEIVFLTKISPAKMGLTMDVIRDSIPKNGAPKPVMRVYGQLHTVKYGTTDKGDWVRFDGQIEAVNLITGEIVRSGSLFLPAQITPILEGQLLAARRKEDFIGLQFAYEIQVIKSTLPIGYEYKPVNLMQGDKDSDPLLAMRETFNKALPKK